MDENDQDVVNGYASPPCFMHELDAAFCGISPRPAPVQDKDVARWRKAERERLIAERLAIEAGARADHSDRIAQSLDQAIGDLSHLTVSAYWPFRGEPDLRSWLETVEMRGGRSALPVVVKKHAPLVFRAWSRGEPLERGVWNIPVPAEGEEVLPDVVIAPVVGFDRAFYRLGYGGGFFDRTLAALPRRPLVIGVGYAQAAIPTIHPQPHDIPMDKIVTEREIMSR